MMGVSGHEWGATLDLAGPVITSEQVRSLAINGGNDGSNECLAFILSYHP